MSKKTRGALALVAAGALTLTMAPQAFASLVDDDPSWNPAKADMTTNVHRIANNDRISTAIEASQYRNDWGQKFSGETLLYNAPGTFWHNQPVPAWVATEAGVEVQLPVDIFGGTQITAVTYYQVVYEAVDVIVARSNDYSDALAATPLADVLNAPVLINPTNELDDRVKAEIQRLQAEHGADGIRVHLLGGTNALSHNVENEIDDAIGANEFDNYTLRYQGIDRYETAANIAAVTVGAYGLDSGADINNVNVYLTTGKNFPDALAAGAAAAENDGVVLLTNDEELDNRGFTDDFLIALNDWVDDSPWGWDINTSEIFAVGGQATRATIANDIRTAETYDGRDRYETATLTARGTFEAPGRAGNPGHFAVVSGQTYADALVASAFIANADGPLLLTKPNELSPVTAAYLEANAENSDHVWTFGGPGAMALSVTEEIEDLLEF